MNMRVVLATVGTFHHFDLAREMHKRGLLEAIYTGYPKFKLKDEHIPMNRIRSFPFLQSPYMVMVGGHLGPVNPRIAIELAWLAQQTLEVYETATLPRCDIFLAHAGLGLKAGPMAQKRGATFICDRGCSHIGYQKMILEEEYEIHRQRFPGIYPRELRKQEAEYEIADAITVPSAFAMRSFIERGVPASKIACVPYGVNLSRFYPTGSPDKAEFNVLFVGTLCLRKGIPYLLEAFTQVSHPRKRLTLVGPILPEVRQILNKFMATSDIHCTGALPQTELKGIMSRSHVMVLPSVEDGFGLVMAQAMACGCPVIATTNTGGANLYQDACEGFIVPIRSPQALADRMQRLAEDPSLRARMSAAALERVRSMGGWDVYGTAMMEFFLQLRTNKTLLEKINLRN